MNKLIGYILSAAGIIGLASTTVPQVAKMLPSAIKKIPTTSLTIASIILVLVGVFFIIQSPQRGKLKKGAEVPIFHGRDVVGYRRH